MAREVHSCQGQKLPNVPIPAVIVRLQRAVSIVVRTVKDQPADHRLLATAGIRSVLPWKWSAWRTNSLS
jgi:hypothetical protein